MFTGERRSLNVRRRLAIMMLVGAGLLAPLQADAAQIHWRNDHFSYLAQHKPLKEFIQEFAANQGLTVSIDPAVEGTVNGRFDLTPQSMLELLASSFGLTWYFDGSVLYLQTSGDTGSEVIRLTTSTVDTLRATLESLSITDDRFPIAYDAERNTMLVSGPRRYVELVKQTARAIEHNETSRGVADIRVFPLRYAWAGDYTFSQGGHEYRLPGVASVLRELFAPGGRTVQNPPPASKDDDDRMSKLARLRGMGMFRDDAVPEVVETRPLLDDESAGEASQSEPSSVAAAPMSGPNLPQFQADGRMNAVLVRDHPERMPFYESVIRALDVKPGMVEIEARILDVSSDAIDSLGIDWRLHSGEVDLQVGRGNLPTLSYGTAIAPGAPAVTPLPSGAGGGGIGQMPGAGVVPPIPSPFLQRGGVLTTVLGDAGKHLIARVNALAQDGNANVLATPRVLTLDNVEAVLENIETFHVRVAGNLDVALFNVSAGTSLRVTPLIVTEGERRQIKLAIRIEDGNFSGQSVDQIPVVRRSSIGTQAFINEGESLLIGGYENEAKLNTQVGVPGLSSIPLLGRLFKYKEKQTRQVQRMFLLTPRVVSP